MNTSDMPPNDAHHSGEPDTIDIDSCYIDLMNSIPSRDPVLCADHEQDIVNLYDQLSDLRLECALLQAQQNKEARTELSEEVVESQLRVAERECLEARSAYLLKNSAIEDILLVAPTLQAVHGGANTNSLDRLLYPLVADRDVVSMVHTNLSTMHKSIMETLTATETERIITFRINQQLTTDLLGLTDQLKAQGIDEISDPELRQTLVKLQGDTKEAKRRWRIMKSLVSAVIAGSGVDWAHSDILRDLVLDDED